MIFENTAAIEIAAKRGIIAKINEETILSANTMKSGKLRSRKVRRENALFIMVWICEYIYEPNAVKVMRPVRRTATEGTSLLFATSPFFRVSSLFRGVGCSVFSSKLSSAITYTFNQDMVFTSIGPRPPRYFSMDLKSTVNDMPKKSSPMTI